MIIKVLNFIIHLFLSKRFDINALINLPDVELIYDVDGVTILKICD